MPFAKIEGIYSVSSEDPIHCASNLLNSDPVKKWKNASKGESSAHVILKLEHSETIKGIDIGNEHSAFIQISVGKTGYLSDHFTELILTSSFMTPIESKKSINTNRLKCFNQKDEAWVKTDSVLNQKWDLIKFTCSQPFNNHVQYGISFVKIHVTPSDSNELVPKKFLKQQDEIINAAKFNGKIFQSNQFIGKFRLRNDSDEDDCNSKSLFVQWKKQSNKTEENQNIEPIEALKKPKTNITKYIEQFDGQKSNMNKKDDIDVRISKDEIKMKKEEKDFKNNQQKNENANNLNKDKIISLKNKNIPFDDISCNNTVTSRNKVHTNSSLTNLNKTKLNEGVNAAFIKSKIKYKPFNKLLEDVVIVISGIQNPDRANIRSKAFELGAHYKSDWDSTCTHLVCAFKNTPKYNQIKSLNGKIVKKSWIENCYKIKKRLSWKKYALDSDIESDSENSEIDDITGSSELKSVNKKVHSPCLSTLSPIPIIKTKNDIDITKQLPNLNNENQMEESQEKPEKRANNTERLDMVVNADNDSRKPVVNEMKRKHQAKDVYDVSTDEDEFTKKYLKIKKNF